MARQGRGPKTNNNKNYRAHEAWVDWKKAGRPKRAPKAEKVK